MSRQAVFHYFFSYYIKQDAATTSEQHKFIVEIFQNITVLFAVMINIW